jgi:hypothetical protein
MIKTWLLFKEIENKSIFTIKGAYQNWQILIPILYKYKTITINRPLFNITERKSSYGRKIRSYEEILYIHDMLYAVIINTLKRLKNMPYETYCIYENKQNYYFDIRLFVVYFGGYKFEDAKNLYKKIRQKYQIPSKDQHLTPSVKIRYMLLIMPGGKLLWKSLKKIKNAIHKKLI